MVCAVKDSASGLGCLHIDDRSAVAAFDCPESGRVAAACGGVDDGFVSGGIGGCGTTV